MSARGNGRLDFGFRVIAGDNIGSSFVGIKGRVVTNFCRMVIQLVEV